MRFTRAQFVEEKVDGVMTTDQIVHAYDPDQDMYFAFEKDSIFPEWQEYLANGGTIDPYSGPLPLLKPLPDPEMQRIDPTFMPSTTSPFQLVCYGKNLEFGSKVLVNGFEVPSVFWDSGKIIAVVNGMSAGSYPVCVQTRDHRTVSLQFIFT